MIRSLAERARLSPRLTSNLNVVSAMFVAVSKCQKARFSSFRRLQTPCVCGRHTSIIPPLPQARAAIIIVHNATSGCALVVNDSGYAFCQKCNVISTAAKQPVVVIIRLRLLQPGCLRCYSYHYSRRHTGESLVAGLRKRDVILADSSDKTTSFTMVQSGKNKG